jgi:hypothetical protein
VAGLAAAPAGSGPDPAGYPQDSAGYPQDPGGYPQGPAGYPDNPAAYPPEQDEPADYPGPPGRGRRRRSAAPDVGRGHPGYEGYVDDPRDLDMAPDQGQEPRDYAPSGSQYPADEEPHAWAEDSHDGHLLPGLDQKQGSRRGNGGGPAGPARKRRRRGRTVLLVLLTVFAVIVAVVGGVGYHYYRVYINPPDFSGAGTASTVVVQIQPGQSASTIGATLAGKGVVASARAFSNAAKSSPQGNALEPGYYQVHLHMKASLALALLLKPSSRLQSKITIPEGFRLAQIIALLGKQTGNLKGYEQAIAHPADLGLPAFANGKPEGYLFPATYDVQPHSSPAAVLKGMVTQFKANAQNIGLQAHAARGPGDAERGHHGGQPHRGRGQAAPGLPQDRRGDLQPPQREAPDQAATRHHRPVRDVAGAQERVQDQFPVPVQHLCARGPAARADRQPGEHGDPGRAAPGSRQLPVLPDHQLKDRRHPVLQQQHGL